MTDAHFSLQKYRLERVKSVTRLTFTSVATKLHHIEHSFLWTTEGWSFDPAGTKALIERRARTLGGRRGKALRRREWKSMRDSRLRRG